MSDIKIIFMGTPEFPVPILEALIKLYNVELVVTQTDKEVGRKKEVKFSPIKELALQNSIKVFQPEKIRNDYQLIKDINPDLIITCAFGQFLTKEILDIPKYGCINVHVSLLPKLRGGAPIHHAILQGLDETGVTIMYMDEKMDAGDIIAQAKMKIEDNYTVGMLHDKMQLVARNLLIETLPSIIEGTNSRTKQNENDASYAYNISREDEHLNFNQDVKTVYNKIRGLNPVPLANIKIDDQEIKVIESYYELKVVTEVSKIVDIREDAIGISAKDGIVYITKIKPAGKKIMDVKDYLNGKPVLIKLGKEVL